MVKLFAEKETSECQGFCACSTSLSFLLKKMCESKLFQSLVIKIVDFNNNSNNNNNNNNNDNNNNYND